MSKTALALVIALTLFSCSTLYAQKECPPTTCPSKLVQITGFPEYQAYADRDSVWVNEGRIRVEKEGLRLSFCHNDPYRNGVLNCEPTVFIPHAINNAKDLLLEALVDSQSRGTKASVFLDTVHSVPAILVFTFTTEKAMRAWQKQLKRVWLNLSYKKSSWPDAELQIER